MTDTRIHNKPSQTDGAELIHELHEGSQAAFKTIYNRLYDAVYWFGMKYLDSEAEVEDILSDVFLAVWTKRSQFQTLESIHMFLHVAVKNRCIDVLRRRDMQAQKHAQLLLSLDTQTDEDTFLEQVQAELMRRIYEQVQQLPLHLREIFMLSYREGLKPAQIAELLQLNVQTVKNRKVTVLKVLKAALNHEPLVLALLLLLEYESKVLA